MRHARAVDYRRRLVERSDDWGTKLTRLTFREILGLGSGEIDFALPVNVICGPNGVGKSTLLKLIWAALDPEHALNAPENAAKLARGSGEVEVAHGTTRTSHAVSFPLNFEEVDERGVHCVHVDTSSDVRRIQAVFARVTDLEPFINGAASVPLSAKEVAEVSYLTRRAYESVGFYEVELADETLPFFEVRLEGQAYDSRTMGSGEFAAFLLWWHLRRAERGTIFLLEEPESFLSPNARESFANILLKFAFDRQLYVIMTSHSGEIISPLPIASVRFFTRGRTGVVLARDALPPVLLKTIGIETRQDILALVEDEAAKTFAKLWAEYFHPSWAKRFDFHVKGSDGEIIRTIRTTQLKYECVTIIGLFDGDATTKVPRELLDRSAFLPGELPVEEMFRRFITADPGGFVHHYGWTNLREILFAIQADDPHDWFENLAHGIGIQKNMLFMAMFNMWMKVPDNERIAREAFNSLLAVLGHSFQVEAEERGGSATDRGGVEVGVEEPDVGPEGGG